MKKLFKTILFVGFFSLMILSLTSNYLLYNKLDQLSPNYIMLKQENNQEIKSTTLNHQDVDVLARLVNAESLNQSLQGKIAVANTVVNRVNSTLFPNTVRDVIYSPGQFHPVGNKYFNREPHNDSKLAAIIALTGINIVPDALYFHNKPISSKTWTKALEPYEICTIEDHTFCSQPKLTLNYEKNTIIIGNADSIYYELQLQTP